VLETRLQPGGNVNKGAYLDGQISRLLTQVTKRDEDSSLMQLKEEFRTYEALRREHDSQIVQIAMEGGLRIAPDQWSSLLYGDQSHKSHMQSIIDKVGDLFLSFLKLCGVCFNACIHFLYAFLCHSCRRQPHLPRVSRS